MFLSAIFCICNDKADFPNYLKTETLVFSYEYIFIALCFRIQLSIAFWTFFCLLCYSNECLNLSINDDSLDTKEFAFISFQY